MDTIEQKNISEMLRISPELQSRLIGLKSEVVLDRLQHAWSEVFEASFVRGEVAKHAPKAIASAKAILTRTLCDLRKLRSDHLAGVMAIDFLENSSGFYSFVESSIDVMLRDLIHLEDGGCWERASSACSGRANGCREIAAILFVERLAEILKSNKDLIPWKTIAEIIRGQIPYDWRLSRAFGHLPDVDGTAAACRQLYIRHKNRRVR